MEKSSNIKDVSDDVLEKIKLYKEREFDAKVVDEVVDSEEDLLCNFELFVSSVTSIANLCAKDGGILHMMSKYELGCNLLLFVIRSEKRKISEYLELSKVSQLNAVLFYLHLFEMKKTILQQVLLDLNHNNVNGTNMLTSSHDEEPTSNVEFASVQQNVSVLNAGNLNGGGGQNGLVSADLLKDLLLTCNSLKTILLVSSHFGK